MYEGLGSRTARTTDRPLRSSRTGLTAPRAILVPLEASHVFDLPLYLLEHETQLRFEPRPPVISEATSEQPRLFKEQAHVLQLGER